MGNQVHMLKIFNSFGSMENIKQTDNLEFDNNEYSEIRRMPLAYGVRL